MPSLKFKRASRTCLQAFGHTLELTMKGISSTTGLEIDIEPFIIDLTSPCSTATSTLRSDINGSDTGFDFAAEGVSDTKATSGPPSSSVSECSEFDFLSDTDGESLLDFLFSLTELYLSLFETLVRDPSPASRAAILYYLPRAPLVQHDITILVPSLIDDEEVMTSLATNIGYYHAHGFISDAELEHLLMQILVCNDVEGTVPYNSDDRTLDLYHSTQQQVERYRSTIIPQQKLEAQKIHQRMLKKHNHHRKKNWRRKHAAAQLMLPNESRTQPGVPLPYGCSTIADVFTDVNEMYTVLDMPSVDWARSRPSSHESIGLYMQQPRVNLPEKGVDERDLKASERIVTVSLHKDMLFSTTRASFESLYPHAKGKLVNVTVKLPNPVCAASAGPAC